MGVCAAQQAMQGGLDKNGDLGCVYSGWAKAGSWDTSLWQGAAVLCKATAPPFKDVVQGE